MSESFNRRRPHPTSPSAHRWSRGAAALLVAVVAFALGSSTAFACHSEISATVTCDGVVTVTAVSWHPGANDGVNNNVKVWYQAAGSSTQVVLTPATPTWNVFKPNSDPAKSYRFTLTFTWPASNPASITVFVQEQVRWGAAQNGDWPSSARSVTINRPVPCPTTTTSTTTTTTTTTSTTTTTTTTEPPTTEPPVTDPPVTDPPVTDPPVTDPPVTQPPVTDPPVTQPPVTDPPVTAPATTQVASESPTVVPSVLAATTIPVVTPSLPATGRDTTTGLVLGTATLAVGAAMIVATRRHR